MTTVLGFTAWFHDSSACLLRDGQMIAFAEEERFSRRKHTPEYPKHAINYVLEEAGMELDDVDTVVFYFDTLSLMYHQALHVMRFFPRSLNLFRSDATVVPVAERYSNLVKMKSVLCREHEALGNFQLKTLRHYKTHQGAAFHCSPFEEAAIITMDVAVDGITQTVAHGRGTSIDTSIKHELPHGWGMVYMAFTHHVGFKFYDEYKVMGMAAYGEPKYVDAIEDVLYTFDEQSGKFALDLDYFQFQYRGMNRLVSEKFHEVFGPQRDPKRPLEQRDYDIAASAQLATERFGIRLAKYARNVTGSKRLCLAGGVVQNCLMNQAIMESGVMDEVFLQPLASDVGCSLGGALYWHHAVEKQPRRFTMEHLYWGPDYADEYEDALQSEGLVYERPENPAADIAAAIADGKVVGFLNGRMEAGPRALGSRSIMADPRRSDMKDILNLRVKHREHFRPFAPSILEERLHDVFEPIPSCLSTQYMITTYTVKPDWREKVPTITHNDGTARPQAVSKEHNPLYWEIINEFDKLTGVPLVVNTSFNDNEPIVCTPLDAIRCFQRTKIDLLVLGTNLAYREANLDRVGTEADRLPAKGERTAASAS